MYRDISNISFIVRFYLLYVILNNYQILKDTLLDKILWEAIPTATILWAVAYGTTGLVIQRADINDSSLRAVIYFVIYLILLAILYFLLWLFSKAGIIPFI